MTNIEAKGLALAAGHQPKVNPLHQRALRILKGTAVYEDRFIPEHRELVELLEMFRSMGCVIAFTTGVWDLFHIGHGDYIQLGKKEAAKLYPDAENVVMVVGVDTDELTRKRKGDDRPIVPMDERCRVLGHLRSVDVITPQYELDQLFGVVSPDVQIVSKTTKDLSSLDTAQKNSAHLLNLPAQAETSTTARIRRLTLDGSKGLAEKIVQVIEQHMRG